VILYLQIIVIMFTNSQKQFILKTQAILNEFSISILVRIINQLKALKKELTNQHLKIINREKLRINAQLD
jgi:hypothetical protein